MNTHSRNSAVLSRFGTALVVILVFFDGAISDILDFK